MAISTARKPSFCPRLWVGILQVCRRSCFCLTKLLHRSVILPLCSGTSYSPKQRSKAAAELVREILLQVMAAMCYCHQRAKNWLCEKQALISIRDQSAGFPQSARNGKPQMTKEPLLRIPVLRLYHSPSKNCVMAVGIDANGKQQGLYKMGLEKGPINSE